MSKEKLVVDPARTGLWYSCCTRAFVVLGTLALAGYLLALVVGG